MNSVLIVLLLCVSQIWASKDHRIIGGVVASNGQYPYAVAFYYNVNDEIRFCGGTIVGEKAILTAAHCLKDSTGFVIYLGTNNIGQENSNAVIVNSTTYVAHPQYNSQNLENDIGIILLSSPITFNDNIKSIELATETLATYEETIAVGWGTTRNEDTLPSDVLYHVSLVTLSNAACQRVYGTQIKDTMVCANGYGSEGICRGDSGGPLVQKNSEGKDILVGVASFFSGYGCDTNDPSGFTRTYEYSAWIKEASAASIVQLFLPILIITCTNFFI
ncbi:brachyurin-like [Tenebrio molitor]|jgi:secreted trypsin-like serine protease|uniref:brachyurin-like n=1 Tax=Tenebrio molitor TaxID=7067 RepID=UPI003624AAA1